MTSRPSKNICRREVVSLFRLELLWVLLGVLPRSMTVLFDRLGIFVKRDERHFGFVGVVSVGVVGRSHCARLYMRCW